MNNKWMPIALFILAIIAIGYAALNSGLGEVQEERPKIGFQAPDFTLPLFDHEQKNDKPISHQDMLTLSEIEGPIILNFWASWCEPCHIEAPDLVEIHEQFGQDITIIAVNATHTDNLEGIKDFVQQYGISFPVLLDERDSDGQMEKGTINHHYEVLALPTTYFIDGNGVIRHTVRGIVSKSDVEIQINRLLN